MRIDINDPMSETRTFEVDGNELECKVWVGMLGFKPYWAFTAAWTGENGYFVTKGRTDSRSSAWDRIRVGICDDFQLTELPE